MTTFILTYGQLVLFCFVHLNSYRHNTSCRFRVDLAHLSASSIAVFTSTTASSVNTQASCDLIFALDRLNLRFLDFLL